MPRFGILILAISLSLLYSAKLFAADAFSNFYLHYKTGAYIQALESLRSVYSKDTKTMAVKEYLTALALSRLQRFDEANNQYEKALKNGSNAEDIYYEFGQSLYAANELERARVAFKKSYAKKFKRPTSLYYMGFISQILEEYPQSITYFDQILKDKEGDGKSLQVAKFQKNESMLALHKQKSKSSDYVEKKIIPNLNDAIKIDSSSSTASDIQARIKELQREFGLDPTKYRNGRKISDKKVKGYVSQEIKYDNNITNSNDQPTIQTTSVDSFIFNTKAKIGGDVDINRRYTITPEMQATITEHSDRDTAVVYTNDSFELNPSINVGYEHTVAGNPATLSFETDFKHKKQDVNRNKQKIFHSRSWTFTLGEKFKIFTKGDTGIKLKYKTYQSYSAPLDNNVTSFSLDQLIITKKGNILLLLLSYDDTDNFNATTNSTASTLLRLDYLIPGYVPSYTFHLAMSLTMLDTKAQKATRGTEVTYSPMFKIQKKLSDSLKISADYTYTKNTSDSISREYTKHVSSLELRYSF